MHVLQDEVFQTEVFRKSNDPVWDASFEWRLTPEARYLTVTVIDHVSALFPLSPALSLFTHTHTHT